MSVWLQLDSGSRKDAYIILGNCNDDLSAKWFPNDERYNQNQNSQTPSCYKVYYGELNSPNNRVTIDFAAHCKERRENLTFDAELCVVTLPACTRVTRPADPVKGLPAQTVNIMDEPYIYVTVADNDNSEGDEFYTNNDGGEKSTFVAYFDKLQIGSNQDNNTGEPPGVPPYDCPAPSIIANVELGDYSFPKYRWAIYKTCMVTPIRINLEAQELIVKLKDRWGKPLVLYEDDNSGAGYNVLPNQKCKDRTAPLPDPNIQTMILMGIKPNYSYGGGIYQEGSVRYQ